MSHYTGPKNRLSRREGLDLFGKGNKLRRASQAPGQHGAKMVRRKSNYGIQLREKQKTRRLYGLTEGQFSGLFAKALEEKGKTGEILLRLLETRLDNVVYRLGFAPTRSMARQLVSHNHVKVDGRVVNIPSFLVKSNHKISLDEKAVQIPAVRARLENKDAALPAWLQRLDSTGTIERFPTRSEIDTPVNEQLIVEYYSR